MDSFAALTLSKRIGEMLKEPDLDMADFGRRVEEYYIECFGEVEKS